MGLFDNLARGVGVAAGYNETGGESGSASTGQPGSRGYRTRKMALVEEARQNRRGAVHKQEVDRKHTLNQAIASTVEATDAAAKHYDPGYLSDLAANAVPMAYIDTLSQDAASANWHIKPRNENAQPDDQTLADAEEFLRDIHPEATFRDLREELARGVLKTGDAPLVKSFTNGDPSGDLVEATAVDSATFFKRVDSQGFTTGYLQVVAEDEDPIPFEKDEIAWLSWSPDSSRVYGTSPVFKGQDTIEILEEIGEKELLDLIQGMPPGIVSRPAETDMPIDNGDWQNFKEDMRLSQGERHRFGFAKFPVNYTSLTPNYQELQLIDRYKTKVTELGGVFKVNPSYAGFDFENVNRATDESQRQSYQQRGFRVLIRLLESAFNRGVVWPHISEDIKFEFEREQSTEERTTKATYLREAAVAGKELADAGLSVSWRDGDLKIDDGDIEAGNVGASSGGGLFASVEDGDADELADSMRHGPPTPVGSETNGTGTAEVSASTDGGSTADEGGGSGNSHPRSGSTNGPTPANRTEEGRRALTKEEANTADALLFDAFRKQIMPQEAPPVEKRIWSTDSQIPEYVQGKLREAIDDGAVFDRFESIPGTVRREVEGLIEDALTGSGGWSLGGMVDRFRGVFGGVTEEQAEVVVRTETASVLNTARELGYQDRQDAATLRFKWVGPDDSRTTDICEELKERTNPEYTDDHGNPGTPLSLNALKRLERRLSKAYFPDLEHRDHVLHPNERHTYSRVLPFELEKSIAEIDEAATDPAEMEFEVSVGAEACGLTGENYRAIVEKCVAHRQDRSSREAEIESALETTIPVVLREVLDANDGTKRHALNDLNGRLDAVGKSRNVSLPTFYNWLEKYHLDA